MTDSQDDMQTYYAERAPVYDRVYDYPERQDDLRFFETYLPKQLSGLDVLEVAAGTGYWTEHIARSARSITATDANENTLRQLRERSIPGTVEVRTVDAYSLEAMGMTFNGAFAGLWLSHVPIEKLGQFFDSLHGCLESGAQVVLMDNTRAQCERLPISHTDLAGNTYQDRPTDAGKHYRVLKNFPTETELLGQVDGCSSAHRFIAREHFWLFQYQLD